MKVITTNVFIALTCITCTQVERTYEQSQKDITEEVDYLKPYLARIGNPSELTRDSAYLLKYECLEDYKQLLVDRANKVLHRFDEYSQKLAKIQTLLTQVKNLLFYKTSDPTLPEYLYGIIFKCKYFIQNEDLTREEEENILEEMNEINFHLQTLETRLERHRNLVPIRFKILAERLSQHPRLLVLQTYGFGIVSENHV